MTDEVVNPKAIKDELIRCASTGEADHSNAVVQYLASGDKCGAQANMDAMIQGALRCDAKEVYFVHNHPSVHLLV